MSSRKLQPSWVVLAAVTVAVTEHHGQEQLWQERFIGLDFYITVHHLRKSGREPGGGVLLGLPPPRTSSPGGIPTHSGLGPHPSITN